MWPFSREPKGRNPDGTGFSDEDRELSKQIRKDRAEIAKQKAQLDLANLRLEHELKKVALEADIAEARARLEDLQGGDDEEPQESGSMIDMAMMTLLTKAIGGQPANVAPAAPQEPSRPSGESLTDEQLESLWEQVPKPFRKIAASWSDSEVQSFIKSRMPGLDQDTLDRALRLVRST